MLGNAELDEEATGPDGQRIAIESKTPRDDLARGIGQLAEALAFNYRRAALVTTLRNAEKINDCVFRRFSFILVGVDSTGKTMKLSPNPLGLARNQILETTSICPAKQDSLIIMPIFQMFFLRQKEKPNLTLRVQRVSRRLIGA